MSTQLRQCRHNTCLFDLSIKTLNKFDLLPAPILIAVIPAPMGPLQEIFVEQA